MIRLALVFSFLFVSFNSAWATHPWNIDNYFIKLNPSSIRPIEPNTILAVNAEVTIQFRHSRDNGATDLIEQKIEIPLHYEDGSYVGKTRHSFHWSAYGSVTHRKASVLYKVQLSPEHLWKFREPLTIEKSPWSYQEVLKMFDEDYFTQTEVTFVQTSYAG